MNFLHMGCLVDIHLSLEECVVVVVVVMVTVHDQKTVYGVRRNLIGMEHIECRIDMHHWMEECVVVAAVVHD